MGKYFIDAGAHDGCSARKFRKEYDPNFEYYIYSFEANPDLFEYFTLLKKHELIHKAVWIKDGTITLYKSQAIFKDGSTLIKNKVTGDLDKSNPVSIECVDFSSWIKNNFLSDDYIILKMDIEGAEYKVLKKMISDGSMNYINELWVEWHRKKINLDWKTHNNLIKNINIPIKKWCALDMCNIRGIDG